MRRVSLAVGLVAMALTACGQVEPVLLVVSVPDCTYQGPRSMTEGMASLSLTMNGLGGSRVVVAELTDDHTFTDLEEHLESVSDDWEDRPRWLSPAIDLTLDDSAGIEGTAEATRLGPGEYAVVCVDLTSGNRSRLVSPFHVEDG